MEQDEQQVRLGTALKHHRKGAGLSQEQLAEAVDVSTEWISQMERGIGTPSLELLVKVAEAVGMEPTALLAAALDEREGRAPVQALLAAVRGLPDDAVATLVDLAQVLGQRWPTR